MRTATFGFYRSNRDIGSILQNKLLEFSQQPRPVDESRTVAVTEETKILLRNINPETDGDFLLDFTRMKNAAGIDLSDLAGNEEKVQFPPNKRLAEFTATIFDCRTSVLAIHEMSSGVSASMVAKYWQMLIPDVGRFRFDPIFEQRAVDDVMKAGAFSKFSLSLAHMGNEARLQSLGLSHNDITDLINKYSAPNITVTLSIDPKASVTTLAIERVRELANALLGLGKRHVKRLSLVTEDEEGRDILVNLLKDRIIVKEDLTSEERTALTHDARYQIARRAWGSQKNDLRNRYRDVN